MTHDNGYPKCDIIGCQYNEDGRCVYDTSPVKISDARACAIRWSHTEEE